MDASTWSTQQLAEFVAVVSTARSEAEAAHLAVERAAEALDADVAAIVCAGELVAAVGYPEGSAPVGDLEAAGPGPEYARQLDVPGVGKCDTATALLEHPPGATMVVARLDGLTREETGLVRGMARVTAITMRMLRVLDDERTAREEIERLAAEQAALRRVATLVATAASPDDVFAAVAAEVGQLLGADYTELTHFLPSETATVAAWSATGEPVPSMGPTALGDRKLAALIDQTHRPERVQYGEDEGPPVTAAVPLRIRSAVGVPIIVHGHLWGVMAVGSAGDQFAPPDTESRLADFTELVATAIANAGAQAELKASRSRIVASADETRRRIERDLHDGAQQRLVSLALRLRAAQAAVPPELDELSANLDSITDELTRALEDLREMARGIHPTILAEGGLGPALKTLARRSSIPVELNVRMQERLPERVEVTAYYVLSEALANAAKHASAAVIHVQVDTTDGVMRLAVSDDGAGGADPARGSGLVGLKDRVEAAGGELTIHSPPGKGTRLVVELPVAPQPTDG
ncbi:histidine kinase [Kribbella sp. NBC_01245]|uniref:GAF domain-containing sensor histidine kinase n=1 Tax=Kribbella sp. NBC_01245 TaxID=2903578 RepID=UPI002E2D4209|nr:histidine kinase [Kribbella sp. NBC_01245]